MRRAAKALAVSCYVQCIDDSDAAHDDEDDEGICLG